LASSADPITVAVSARRSNASTSSSTCVTAQDRQRPRRGRTRSVDSRSLSDRGRAEPHGASTPPHGQVKLPPSVDTRREVVSGRGLTGCGVVRSQPG
jgi:hypothetical protein